MLQLMDCTLRDGANVAGSGFSAEITRMVLSGLLECGVRTLELGNALGMGSPAAAPLTDAEYIASAAPFAERGELGMFMGWQNATADLARQARAGGLRFLRVGVNAGDGDAARPAVSLVKEQGLYCRCSLMKAYVLPPEQLAEEAERLALCGVDEVTVMDSAGCMRPAETAAYVRALKARLRIPVFFHGHNNMGLAAANALAAYEAGADGLDTCLCGMARSAGNIPTEGAAALMREKGELLCIDLWGLLRFLDETLLPAVAKLGYAPPIPPQALVLGMTGCHSGYLAPMLRIARETGVDAYRLIEAVSRQNRKNPDERLMRCTAERLKEIAL